MECKGIEPLLSDCKSNVLSPLDEHPITQKPLPFLVRVLRISLIRIYTIALLDKVSSIIIITAIATILFMSQIYNKCVTKQAHL